MLGPIKVLILEDREADAVLIASALRDQGFDFLWQRVHTEAEYKLAMNGAVDVVLADYQLCGFTAMDAVRWTQEAGKDIPVIVVTGALGDEAAAECIRGGAVDYVLKDRLARLGAAITRALEQQQLRDKGRRVLLELERSERRFRKVFESSPLGLVVLDAASRILDANHAFVGIAGLPAEQLKTRFFHDLLSRDSRGDFARAWEVLRQSPHLPDPVQLVVSTNPAGPVWISSRLTKMDEGSNSGSCALAICEDVSAAVRAAATARRKTELAHAVAVAAETFLTSDDWDRALAAFLRLVGEAADADVAVLIKLDALGLPQVSATWQRADCAWCGDVQSFVERVFLEMPVAYSPAREWRSSHELMHTSDGGTAVRVHALVVPVPIRAALWGHLLLAKAQETQPWPPEEFAVLKSAADLLADALRDAESSHRLRTNEKRLRLLVDAALDAVISLDGNGFITGWNRRAQAMFGYGEDEVRGSPLLSVVAPPHAHEAWRAHGLGGPVSSAESAQPRRFTATAVSKNGDEFPVEVSVAGVHEGPEPMLCVFVRDLTEQKRMETTLDHMRDQDERLAAHIQQTLLTQPPLAIPPTFTVAVLSEAGTTVSGDFLWTFPHGEEVLDVVIGDVMGKGIAAALVGAITKNYLHDVVGLLGRELQPFGRLPNPREIAAALNNRLAHELEVLESFVTLIYARLDAQHNTLSFVNCGHTEPVHLRVSRRSCERIAGGDMPIGITGHQLLRMHTVPFEPGDTFFFYSDGTIDAENERAERFGSRRLRTVLARGIGDEPEALLERVRRAVASHCSCTALTDDLTFLVVRVNQGQVAAPQLTRAIEIPGDPSAVGRLQTFVTNFCRDLPGEKLADEQVRSLALATHEAARNAIEHAHESRPDIGVQVVARAYHDSVEIRVYDFGAGFTPDTDWGAARALESGAPRGLQLIRSSVSELEYRTDELGRNYLRLVVRRAPSGSSSA